MVGVMIDSLALISRLSAGKMAANAYSLCVVSVVCQSRDMRQHAQSRRIVRILDYGILLKTQQKLVIVLYITKQKLVFSIVVLVCLYRLVCHCDRSLSLMILS